jgi:hypothetical protein
MNKYGALVEFDTDGKNEALEKDVSQCPFVHHKSQINRPDAFLMKAKYAMQSNMSI